MYQAIKEFNQYYIDNMIQINTQDYFHKIHIRFYPEMDISFREFFLEVCDKNGEFCIHHSKLVEYGIVSSDDKIGNIKRCLRDRDLKEGDDYQIESVTPKHSRGAVTKKEIIYLTPYGFKSCLIGSKNTKKYYKYYLLLEDVHKYYSDYEKAYHQKIIEMGKEQIKKKEKKISRLEQILVDNNIILKKMDKKTDDLNNKMDKLYTVAHEISTRSVPKSPNINNTHEFMLLQNNEDNKQFMLLRGKHSYLTLRKKKMDGFTVIIRSYSANPINFSDLVKDEIRSHNNMYIESMFEIIKEDGITDQQEITDKIKHVEESYCIEFERNKIILGKECRLDELLDIIQKADNKKYETLKQQQA